MDVVYTGNTHNKSLIYSGTEVSSKPSTGWGNLQGQETNGFNEAFVEFLSCWDLNATTVESKTAKEIRHNCQTNAKYNIRQITKTLTNTKYQTANKCQTDDPSPKCQLKYTENELKFQNTKEQMIIAAKPPGFAARTKYGLPDMMYFENLVQLPDIETQRSFSCLSKHEFKLKLQHSHTSRWTRPRHRLSTF